MQLSQIVIKLFHTIRNAAYIPCVTGHAHAPARDAVLIEEVVRCRGPCRSSPRWPCTSGRGRRRIRLMTVIQPAGRRGRWRPWLRGSGRRRGSIAEAESPITLNSRYILFPKQNNFGFLDFDFNFQSKCSRF